MIQIHDIKHILVIDHQSSWRELSMRTLKDEGYSVEGSSNYLDHSLRQTNPDLIILGCARVGSEELQFITQLLLEKHHLLVLSAYLPKSVMRSLFMQGVDDIVDKPYSPNALVQIVREVLDTIAQHEEVHTFAEERR